MLSICAMHRHSVSLGFLISLDLLECRCTNRKSSIQLAWTVLSDFAVFGVRPHRFQRSDRFVPHLLASNNTVESTNEEEPEDWAMLPP